ncbi:tRNA methyltransferase 11, partial [Cichlidogyrus casuarinus]
LSCLESDFVDEIVNGSDSIKIHISSTNKKLDNEQRLALINRVMVSFKSVKAPISLASPEVGRIIYFNTIKHQIGILLEYPTVGKLPDFAMGFNPARRTPCEGGLQRVLCGLFVSESNRREILGKYNLSKRTYLGNTSMNVCLAGIAANLALTRKNDIVFDPFLGSGGCVLAASVWGSLGFGSDIDYALIHGIDRSPRAGQGARLKDECLRTSYRQYGLENRYLDVLVADASFLTRTLPDRENLFDAILTDPPYGVRESSKRVSKQRIEREPSLLPVEEIVKITGGKEIPFVPDANGMAPVPHDLPHFPHKEQYPLDETFKDLLEFSAKYLRPRGRLVFWMPILRKLYTGEHCLPSHSRLRRLTFCEQVLNQRNSRALIVMEKLSPKESFPQPDKQDGSQLLLSKFLYKQPHAKQKMPFIYNE